MRDAAIAPTCGRLTKRSQFLAVASGRRFHTARMTVQSIGRAPISDAGTTGVRIGLTVTKKTGQSTERNRIRRRLRAAVKVASGQWPAADLDMVIVARREALSVPFPILVDDLARALPALTNERQWMKR